MSQQALTESQPISLDSVFNALKHWRNNKSAYDEPGIPSKIWVSIFQLEKQGYGKSDFCRLLGLNSEQYNKKRRQYYASIEKNRTEKPKPAKATVAIESNVSAQFSEAIVVDDSALSPVPPLTQAAEQTKQAVSQLKSTDTQPDRHLDLGTIVVECIRPDGHRLKIHTTTARLDVVMQSFFNQEVVAL